MPDKIHYLVHDPVDLAILGVDLITHVKGHVAQVTNDAAHLFQVFIHLIFSGIICYPVQNHTNTIQMTKNSQTHIINPECISTDVLTINTLNKSPFFTVLILIYWGSPHLRMKPPLIAICSRSSTTRAGWLFTTPSWLLPQALLPPLFILFMSQDEYECQKGWKVTVWAVFPHPHRLAMHSKQQKTNARLTSKK